MRVSTERRGRRVLVAERRSVDIGRSVDADTRETTLTRSTRLLDSGICPTRYA